MAAPGLREKADFLFFLFALAIADNCLADETWRLNLSHLILLKKAFTCLMAFTLPAFVQCLLMERCRSGSILVTTLTLNKEIITIKISAMFSV